MNELIPGAQCEQDGPKSLRVKALLGRFGEATCPRQA